MPTDLVVPSVLFAVSCLLVAVVEATRLPDTLAELWQRQRAWRAQTRAPRLRLAIRGRR